MGDARLMRGCAGAVRVARGARHFRLRRRYVLAGASINDRARENVFYPGGGSERSMRKFLLLWGLVVTLAALASGCGSPAPADDGPAAKSTEEPLSFFPPRKSLRIAVVGAGPSGLSAADTLKSLGYQNVTVFEKNDRVGGKVYSYRSGGQVSELGAVFASPDYTKVLGLANKYGIPYEAYGAGQKIISDRGAQDPQAFLTTRYSQAELLAAVAKYAAVQALFVSNQADGFWLDVQSDLYMPFDQFAKKYEIEPITEVARSVMIGFGYGYYETAPALYYMKLLPWLLKIGLPNGLVPATYYTFPTGYQ